MQEDTKPSGRFKVGVRNGGFVVTIFRRVIMILVVVGMGFLWGGCSSFERRWKEAPANAPSGLQPLLGKWEGTWSSEKGHGGGSLRAIMVTTQAPSSATGSVAEKYSATFKATFWKVLSGDYTVEMEAQPVQRGSHRVAFGGSKNLGMLAGGVYRYEGYVSGEEFFARYESAGDAGVFRMRRAR